MSLQKLIKWVRQKQLKESVNTLCEELNADEGYRYSWHANIAMAFKDEWQRAVDNGGLPATPDQIHVIANDAAKNFLDLLTKDSK